MAAGELVRPPRLEDAGLEDCALPPESIAEAFSLAAAARLSHLALSDDDDDEGDLSPRGGGGCVEDAGPTCGAIPDALLGAGAGADEVVVVGGGGGGGAADEVVVPGADEVVVVGGGGGGGGGGGAADEVVVGGCGDEKDRVLVVGEEVGEEEEKGCVEGIGEGVEELGHRDSNRED